MIFHGVIYKITNLVNGKIYIGQTVNSIQRRFNSHVSGKGKDSGMKICRAINKYGKHNFAIEIIDWATNLTELNYKEWLLICKFDSINGQKGYNTKYGGNNHRLSDATKKKISAKNSGRKCSEKTKNQIKKTLTVLTNTPEYIEKASIRASAMWAEAGFKEKHAKAMSEARTPDRNKRQGEKLKKKWQDPVLREKWLSSRSELYKSEEFINKMSDINTKIAEKRYSNEFYVYKAILAEKNGRFRVYKKGEKVGSWLLINKCAADMGIFWTGISQCLNGSIKQYKGYIFQFKEERKCKA